MIKVLSYFFCFRIDKINQYFFMTEEFALFLDDSGSPKPNLKDPLPYFAIGGILVKRQDELIIQSAVKKFKENWNISPEYPLHGNEIRSKKKGFAWLGKLDQQEYNRFMDDLTELIITSPIIVHACVVSRSGYHQRYLEMYDENTWEMMKSAFSIIIERCAKYVDRKNGKIMVYYEKMGKKEDRLIEQYFEEMRTSGHPFNSDNAEKYLPLSSIELSSLLRGIEGKSKSRNELQLADLCLYPIVKSKENPNNKALIAMKKNNLIIDCLLKQEEIETLGIKYYCFDHNF